MKIRYSIVCEYSVGPTRRPKLPDSYTLAGPANWAECHYNTAEEALKAFALLKPQMEERLGMRNLHVIPIECYDHGESVRTVFDAEYIESNKLD